MTCPNGLTWAAAIGAWAVLLAAAMGAMHAYMATPGMAIVAPVKWPANAAIPLQPGVYSLVLFVHPHCPCTDSTITNLSSILTGHGNEPAPVNVTVTVSGPAAMDGCPKDLERRLRAIDGVTIRLDADGTLARAFGALTSGHIVLSDDQGQIQFTGGITPGRGHSGPCESLSRLAQVLARTPSAANQATHATPLTPVYGCPIFNATPSAASAIAASTSHASVPLCCEQPQGDQP